MERVQVIEYKGKAIIYLDFSRCGKDELIQVIEAGSAIIRKCPPASALTLSNFTGFMFTFNMVDLLKEFTLQNKPYVKAAAVIGVTGLRKIPYEAIMKITKRNLPSFDTQVEAMEYLVNYQETS
ncbi:MAG: hypothetical protein K6U80_02610 [Firmicutes bacterium]|nr:hypothetical protein [Bacillota bacterium]